MLLVPSFNLWRINALYFSRFGLWTSVTAERSRRKLNLKIVALAGGVGGAKLAHGLAGDLPPEDLTVIVNTGDDFEHYGLSICPDLDTVCYTLAGLANPETGWGRIDQIWNVIGNASRLGGPGWFTSAIRISAPILSALVG